MAGDEAPFYLLELKAFDIEQLKRIAGFLQIQFTKKTTKKELVNMIWEVIKPPPIPVMSSEDVTTGSPVSCRIAMMNYNNQFDGDKPNLW